METRQQGPSLKIIRIAYFSAVRFRRLLFPESPGEDAAEASLLLGPASGRLLPMFLRKAFALSFAACSASLFFKTWSSDYV